MSSPKVFKGLVFRALSQIKRTPLQFFFSQLVIGISLFVLLLIVTLLFNFYHLRAQAQDNMLAMVFLWSSAEKEAKEAQSQIQAISPHIKTELLSPDQALARIHARPTGVSMPWIVSAHSAFSDAAINQSFFKEIEKLNLGEILRPNEEINRAKWVIRLFYGAGIVIALLLSLLVVVLVTHAIRTSVLERLPEIRIMRLVGATEYFIRSPFMVEGIFIGFCGSLSAFLMMSAFHLALDQIEILRLQSIPWWIFVAITTLGSVLGMLGSTLGALSDSDGDWGMS